MSWSASREELQQVNNDKHKIIHYVTTLSINQSINQPTNQSINQSINQSTNQPINQSSICSEQHNKTSVYTIHCRTGHKGVKHLQVPQTKPNNTNKQNHQMLTTQR